MTKRFFDIIISFASLLSLSVLILLLALFVWVKIGSPVFFTQRRPGLQGKPFTMIKFRTMTNARGADAELLPDAERLTRFGSFLRATSLDELPALWNVLKGDMSLVGPRPLLMEYLTLYSPEQARRHNVRPGITGWAQVNGRNGISWHEKFLLDVWYVDNRSFLLDLRIIWLTVLKVIQREGISAPGQATMPKFERKKILILGGNPETRPIVDVANALGFVTVVLDPQPKSIAKSVAAISVNVDGLDVEAVCQVARNLDIHGVLVGVADTLVTSYFEVCSALNLPCYASQEAVLAFSSKNTFRKVAHRFDIATTPTYTEDEIFRSEPSVFGEYPILIKPDDSGGGVGISVCNNASEAARAIAKARLASKSGGVLIEQYMVADDMLAYYEIACGQPYLLATADRLKTNKQTNGSPVCIGALYPSRHEHEFVNSVHPKIVQMLQGLKIDRGIFCLQFFKDIRGFFAYDPGFRFQGEGVHYHIQHSYSFDQREGFIKYAMGESIPEYFHKLPHVRVGADRHAVTVWVLLSAGTIDRVSGLHEVTSLQSYKSHVKRLGVGDCVTEEMLGTEKQVFVRIYLQHDNASVIIDDVKFINESLKVYSEDRNLVLDMIHWSDVKESISCNET